MGSRTKGMAWFNNICQKTETFFAEVEDLISQEPLKYVENELLTVSGHVKQFCSDFLDGVFDMAEEGKAPEGLQNISTNLESSLHELSVKESNNDLPIKKHCDIEDNATTETIFHSYIEKIISSENGNSNDEDASALFFSFIDKVITSENENENDTSLSCGVRQPDAVSDDCLKDSPISKLKLGESCIIVDSNETCSASECEANHLYHQKSLIRAFSSMLKFGKERKHKKAALNEEADRCGTPASATAGSSFESLDQDFGESEWEII